MTREPQTAQQPGSPDELGHDGMAAGSDGLPLPPPDDPEKRLAEDPRERPDDEELDDEQESLAEELSAERGAD